MAFKNNHYAIALLVGFGFALSSAYAQEVEKQILITNVRVFDGIDTSLRSADVLVEGNLIRAVGSGIDKNSTAVMIDGGGRVPGAQVDHDLSLSTP